ARAFARYSVLLSPIVVGVLLTTSRAGFFLAIASVLVMIGLERSRSHRASAVALAALVVAVVGISVVLFAQGDLISARLAGSDTNSDVHSRLAVAKITLRAIADRPWLGWGFSTFPSVFPLYRDETLPLPGKWEEAHNSYLEAILGLGLPVALILF